MADVRAGKPKSDADMTRLMMRAIDQEIEASIATKYVTICRFTTEKSEETTTALVHHLVWAQSACL